MNWLQATYQPTTLFSLKPSWATSSGGKSLLLPSPYALKMALLDVAIRVDGLISAESDWAWLRRLQIGIRLPEQFVVTNLFARILRKKEFKGKKADKVAFIQQAIVGGNWPFQSSIGYREYVYYPAPMTLIIGCESHNLVHVQRWLLNLTYLGKRGGFVQLLTPPTVITDIGDFVQLTQTLEAFPLNGLMQQLDDCDPKMKFDQANIYTKSRPKRITRQVVLPYRLTKSSRTYSLYQRVPNRGI
ncbi:MAG TPA: hypothetical protein ENJ56_07230 [Anaerolineae bacterium]|nr:hypothetical protein [Anaerolineae bacterium]